MGYRRKDFIGRVCICGRSLEQVHCSECGTTNVYALASKTTTVAIEIDGKLVDKEFSVYRCRRCGTVFSEYDLLYHCEAPKPVVRIGGKKIDMPLANVGELQNLGSKILNENTDEARRPLLEEMFGEMKRSVK